MTIRRADIERVADGLRAEEILAGVDGGLELLESARRLRDQREPPSSAAIARRGQLAQILERRARLENHAWPGPATIEPSPRELEVLQCAARGLWNHEIAVELYIAEETVKSHFKSLQPKLGSRNRAHAVALAIGRGLIQPPTERHE